MSPLVSKLSDELKTSYTRSSSINTELTPIFRATICSIFKTIELRTIVNTTDPTWDGVNLSIWSQTELSIGILIASLPPLRKAFDSFFEKILPSTITNSHRTPQYGYGHSSGGDIRMKTFEGSKAYHSRIPGESILDADDESDRAILDEEEHKGPGIMKSTKVTIQETNGDSGSSSHKDSSPTAYKQSIDWQSPHLGQSGPHAR